MTPDMQERDRKAHDYVCTRFPNALEITHQESFKAGWDACASAVEGLVKALEKLTMYCPAEDKHGTEEDCRVYGCKEGRAALSSWAARIGGK